MPGSARWSARTILDVVAVILLIIASLVVIVRLLSPATVIEAGTNHPPPPQLPVPNESVSLTIFVGTIEPPP